MPACCCMLGSFPLFGVGGPDVGGVAPPALAGTVGGAFPPAGPPPTTAPPLPTCAEGDFIFSFIFFSCSGRWLSNQIAVVPEEYPPTTLTLMTTTSPTAAVILRLC